MEKLLPLLILKIADITSMDIAFRILDKYKGTRIFIPKHPNDKSKLTSLIELNNLKLLSQHFGGKTLTVPKANSYYLKIRNTDIIRRYSNGESSASLAQNHNLTERQVYTILCKS
jgi:hypothetical protein